MREKEVEAALVKAAKKRNGVALKFVSPGLSGVPDRLVLLPNGKIGFIELKAPGKKMRLLQEKRKSQLERLGFLVFCLDNKEEVEVMLDAIQAT
nr:MAG TPA: Nuclease [Caudoviricetes sp.]